MQDHLDAIKAIGFVPAGRWYLTAGSLKFELNDAHRSAQKVLYAFVVDGQLTYVGKTMRSLKDRMAGYSNPGPTQSTNIKNNKNIRECLEQRKSVEILVLPDNGLLHYGGFHVSLAAGLEDDVIRKLSPLWNAGKKETPAETLEPIENGPTRPTPP